jgi:hypothetical protein
LNYAVREYELSKRQSAAAPSKPASKKPDPNKIPLGKAEASRMSDRNIMDSVRPVDKTRPENMKRTLSRAEVLKSREPFNKILDDALEVASE